MYNVIQILILKYTSICTGKKEHEKMSTKVVTLVPHFNGKITGNYFPLYSFIFTKNIRYTFIIRQSVLLKCLRNLFK